MLLFSLLILTFLLLSASIVSEPRIVPIDALKYVVDKNDIDCRHFPLDQNGTETGERYLHPLTRLIIPTLLYSDIFKRPEEESGTRFAYAWYITRPQYLCSAIVAMKSLNAQRQKDPVKGFTFPVDFVLVHAKNDLKNDLDWVRTLEYSNFRTSF